MIHQGKIDETKCKEDVESPGFRGMFSHQCSRNVWKDGYCRIHHPDNVKIRQAKQDERRENNNPYFIMMDYSDKLRKANERIAELEAELRAAEDKISLFELEEEQRHE